MPMVFVLIALVFSIVACTQGRWVKADATLEHTQQDYLECETLSSLRPPPVTLGEKRSANPDLSSLEIQKCMKNKGYQWVSGNAQPQQKEILEIVPVPDHLTN